MTLEKTIRMIQANCMFNELLNNKMETKVYLFSVDLIHLETHYDDWYEEFPVLLTNEEFEELCKAQKKWMQTDEWKNRDSDADEEYFIKKYCPGIYPRVKTSLKDFAVSKYGEGIVKELYNADIYIPGEVWEINRKL